MAIQIHHNIYECVYLGMRFPAVETADDLLPEHGRLSGIGGLDHPFRQRGEFLSRELALGIEAVSEPNYLRLLLLILQRFTNELEQRLRRRIIRQAEVVVELGVVGVLGSEDLGGNAGILQHGLETLRLCGGVWMIGDM